MTHEISTISHYVAGDYTIIEFTVGDNDDPNNDTKDLTGASITWELRDNGQVVLDDGDGDVSITITDAANGRFDVELDTGATSDLKGVYTHRVTVTDSNSRQNTFTGQMKIHQ